MDARTTALYDTHVALGAKMVDFAGFKMPIQYTGILAEHMRVRSTVGVFDVSHMGEVIISGPRRLEMVNRITTNNAANIALNQAQYTAMCYPEGGIVDDLIVYHRDDHYLLVINASNIAKDVAWMQENAIDGADIRNVSDEWSQLAVQGKDAEATLQKLTDVPLGDIQFYWFVEGELAGVPMIISRTGYTGEPGFELYVAREHSRKVWDAVFDAGAEFDIAPIGLGARDSLRLEKKYCLYGNDITADTNPYEAGLGWITKLDKGDFIGREVLQAVKAEGVTRKLMGFVVDGRLIPRHGYPVLKNGDAIGEVTSGAYSPVLEKNIGLAYVAIEHARVDETIEIEARGRRAEARIVKTPFV